MKNGCLYCGKKEYALGYCRDCFASVFSDWEDDKYSDAEYAEYAADMADRNLEFEYITVCHYMKKIRKAGSNE